MKQYVQTDLEANRQIANTLAELIIDGLLASIEVSLALPLHPASCSTRAACNAGRP